MNKKIKELRTIVISGGNYNLTASQLFDIESNKLIQEGFQPYDSVKVDQTEIYTSRAISTTTLGGHTRITQQFVKYEESALTVQNIQPSSQEFNEWKKERFCHETSYLNYHLFFNNSECHGKLSLNSDSFILDIYPFQVTEDIGNGAGKAVRKIFKRNS